MRVVDVMLPTYCSDWKLLAALLTLLTTLCGKVFCLSNLSLNFLILKIS